MKFSVTSNLNRVYGVMRTHFHFVHYERRQVVSECRSPGSGMVTHCYECHRPQVWVGAATDHSAHRLAAHFLLFQHVAVAGGCVWPLRCDARMIHIGPALAVIH